MPPVGMWKLWQDTTLTSGAKWRVVLYLFVLPTLAYAVFSLWLASSAMQRLMP